MGKGLRRERTVKIAHRFSAGQGRLLPPGPVKDGRIRRAEAPVVPDRYLFCCPGDLALAALLLQQ